MLHDTYRITFWPFKEHLTLKYIFCILYFFFKFFVVKTVLREERNGRMVLGGTKNGSSMASLSRTFYITLIFKSAAQPKIKEARFDQPT